MTAARWVVVTVLVALLIGALAAVIERIATDEPVSLLEPSPTANSTLPIDATPLGPETTATALASAPLASLPTGSVQLASLLTDLVVAPPHLEDYERDLFPLWIDEDGDGCNTRYEVLIDEAVTTPAVSESCDLTGGSWLSPFDGLLIEGAEGVQIDHLVALAEAWYSGAFAWSTLERERFANDLGVPWALNAVSPSANETKGASDPAEWLPPRDAALCPYVEAWIGTKWRWRLSVDVLERSVLEELVLRCPPSMIRVPQRMR